VIKRDNTESYLPKMILTDDGQAPEAPMTVKSTGIERSLLLNLVLKVAHIHSQISTDAAAEYLLLSRNVTNDLLEQLRSDSLIEALGQDEAFGYRYSISNRGREMASRLLESNGYIGPAPVPLESYKAMLEWQVTQSPPVSPEQVKEALGDMILSEDILHTTGLAISSGRSLFLSGPPGNGKTSMGRKLHNALSGTLWIPHCIATENNIIRVFDSHCHDIVSHAGKKYQAMDRRWVKIHRPFIVAGGEMTLESLDLAYLPALKFYEAPLHMKANGGTFLIDDFGRQCVEPETLLNRWIIPLEHQIDFLTLHTGQKIQVPFLLRLIIATNLDTKKVTDPAFLRRLGYRAHINGPDEDMYNKIFLKYAASNGLEATPDIMEYIFKMYRSTQREMRACEPRDLIERVRDICVHTNQPFHLSTTLLSLSWKGYFGSEA
jgi:predicted ATPase with chaperone activity